MRNLIFISCFALFSCTSITTRIKKPEKEIIGLQPIGEFDQDILEEVRDSLVSTYGREFYILPSIDYPEHAFVNIKFPRYRADSLIRFLRATKPDSLSYVIGMCSKDISTTKYSDWANREIKEPEKRYRDWGIFGLGFSPGPSCVVSSYRLKKGVSKEQYRERVRKVTKHEFGHNLGLPHCPNKNCLMTDAVESIKTIDKEKEGLCAKCWSKIK